MKFLSILLVAAASSSTLLTLAAALPASQKLPSSKPNPDNFGGISDLEKDLDLCKEGLSNEAQNGVLSSPAEVARCDVLQAAVNKIPGALGNLVDPPQ